MLASRESRELVLCLQVNYFVNTQYTAKFAAEEKPQLDDLYFCDFSLVAAAPRKVKVSYTKIKKSICIFFVMAKSLAV